VKVIDCHLVPHSEYDIDDFLRTDAGCSETWSGAVIAIGARDR